MEQPPGADEGGGDAGEGGEVAGLALVAAVQPAEGAGPGLGALDHPAVSAEALGGVDASTSDTGRDLSSSQVGADEAVVVCLVGVQLAGPAAPGSAT